MIFADCRKKYTKDAYPNGTQIRRSADIPEDEINPYWEGNLDKTGKDFVGGYDCAVQEVEAFFANMDDYVDGVANDQRQEISMAISQYLERSRDEVITSLIDNQQEDNDGQAQTNACAD